MENGNVVLNLTLGETKIKICDDSCATKTPQEVAQILKTIAEDAYPSLRAQMLKGEERAG